MTANTRSEHEPASRRTTVRRLPERGRYDPAAIHAILDEALVCHVGFVHDGQPFVIPTTYARVGDRLFIHGSAASRLLKAGATGVPVCVTVTLLDGLVLARSGFHHSMNYRSVVVVGNAQPVTDPEEKRRALDAVVEHVVPGRTRDVRGPTAAELSATLVFALPLDEASAKIRTGPPKDDAEDLAQTCWAGEIPLRLVAQPPVPDSHVAAGARVPGYVTDYRRPGDGK